MEIMSCTKMTFWLTPANIIQENMNSNNTEKIFVSQCTRQPLRWIPMIPTSSYPHFCNLLLTNNRQQHWWDITFVIRLPRNMTSILLAYSIAFMVACFDEAAAMLDRPIWQKTVVGWRQLRTEAFNPTTLKALNSANNHMSMTSGSQAFRWDPGLKPHLNCSGLRDPEA